MSEFRLIERTQDGAYNRHRGRNEECFRYRDDNDNEVKFHAHPTRAFNYVVVEGDQGTANRVINAFINRGLDQNEYAGGFAEAISVLNI